MGFTDHFYNVFLRGPPPPGYMAYPYYHPMPPPPPPEDNEWLFEYLMPKGEWSDADARIEQNLILDFKSCIALHHLFCISIYLYLVEPMSIFIFLNLRFVIILDYVGLHHLFCISIYLYLVEPMSIFIFLNLRFVIVLDYVGLLIYNLYKYWWMMRILSLKYAIQWYMKLFFASSHPYKQGNLFPHVKLLCIVFLW
jgi:hypothetical protein